MSLIYLLRFNSYALLILFLSCLPYFIPINILNDSGYYFLSFDVNHVLSLFCLFDCVILVYYYNFIAYVLKCNANEFVASYLRLRQLQLPELPLQSQVQVQLMHKMHKNVMLFVLRIVR